jgi:DNA polymerase III alpha subunit (gram-positive type)
MDWKKWNSFKLQENLEEEVQTSGLAYSQMKKELDNLRDSTFIFFDTETMGFNPKYDQITQIGFSSISFQNGKEGEREENNIYIELTPQTRERLENGTEENQRWKDSQRGSVEKVERSTRLTDEEKQEKIKDLLDPYWVLRFTGRVDKNNEFKNVDSMEERRALEEFMTFIRDQDNPILVAHNSSFDMKMVNGRLEKYGMEKLEPGVNIREILDTLALSREQHLPALLDLKQKFISERNAIEGLEDIDQMFAAAQQRSADELAAAELDFHPEANVNDLTNKTLLAINDAPEELREKMLRVVILNTLISSLSNTYQNGRAALGTLANSFKITADGAHDAIYDVRMTIKIYNNMYKVISMAIDYLGEGADSLTSVQKKAMKLKEEMEPYQKKMHAKHPRWKARLTRGGQVKDESTPYKYKLSLKRGKSAPPGAGG